MSLQRLGVIALAASLIASSGAGAQSSRLYVTAGDNHIISILQGGAVVQQFSQQSNEYAVAVYGDVRTLYNGNPGNKGSGAQYTLGGTFTGTTYPYPVGSALFYDGATNGTSNFAVDYGSGDVWQMDRNWANAAFLFNVGNQSYGSALGITYDPFANALWVSGWNGTNVTQWSMTGTMLSSFNTSFNSISSLAMDYSDGTLWMSPQLSGRFYQYSTAGALLGTQSYNGIGNYLGGEFDFVAQNTTPEPASVVLFASGLLALVPVVRRRIRK